MQPEDSLPADLAPEDFLEDHCQDYILVEANASLSAALEKLQKRKGHLDWTLVVSSPTGYAAAPFKEIFKWERGQSDRSSARSTVIAELDLPLAALEVCQDNAALQEMYERANRHPYGLVLVTWEGTGIVYGVAETHKISEQLKSTKAPPAAVPAISEAVSPEPPIMEPGSQQTAKAAAVVSLDTSTSAGTKSIGEHIDDFEARVREKYTKFRIGYLVGFISFLVALLSLAWTARNDILPVLFPPQMSGEWNVAVAEFSVQEDQAVSQNKAKQMSNVFFTKFNSEIENLADEAGIAIQVLDPAATGLINGSTPEERAAKANAVAGKYNADVVIYGTIVSSEDLLSFTPEFYVDIHNMYEAEEMVGQHSLGEKIILLGGNLEEQSQVQLDRELSRRSKLMALVTKGLSLYFGGFYTDAYQLFQEANRDENWPDESGREVMHLFTGNAANRSRQAEVAQDFYMKALGVDDQYARAYIGLGHAQFAQALAGACSQDFQIDSELLDAALGNFIKAESADNKPPSADISAKSAFGKGQVYITKYYSGEKSAFSDSQEQFQMVIDEYIKTDNERIKELASEAHARLGLLARQQGDLESAAALYEKGLELASDHARRGFILITLADINQRQGDQETHLEYAEKAIEAYNGSLTLTSDPELRANHYKGIAVANTLLGETKEAVRAFEEALDLLPEGDCEHIKIQAMLEEAQNP